jgi:hypothetical protein
MKNKKTYVESDILAKMVYIGFFIVIAIILIFLYRALLKGSGKTDIVKLRRGRVTTRLKLL